MAEAIHRVGIEIDIDSANLAARIKAIEKQIKAMEKAVSRMDRRGDGINDRFKKLDNRMSSLGQVVKRVTGLFTKLFTTFAKFSFLAMAGELAIFTAGLLAVKLALITGRAAASLYNITLKGLSVTAAAVGTALATAAAAMRQFQEAQLSPFFADARSSPTAPLSQYGRRGAAGRLGRGIGATTSGLLGMEGTQQVVAALARAGITGNQGIGLAQGLGNLTNFDPKAMAQIIQALGGAVKTGSISPALSAVQNAVGFRGGSISASSANSLISQISSGSLTGRGFQGQGDMLSKTMIGTFKTSFVGIRDQFADIGVSLLEPMRQSFLEIAQILQRSMLSLQVIIQRFGADSMGPTMVTIFDRMMRFITENIIDHLGKIKQMGESFVGFFRSVRNFFVEMGDFLGKYEPAANVIIDMFRAASGANKSALFRNFSEGLVANADRIKEFGAGMGRLFGGIFTLFESGNQGFFGGLERITKITDSISDELIPALREFFAAATPIAERIPTVIEALSSVLQMIAPAIQLLAGVISQLIGALGMIPGVGSELLGTLLLGGVALKMSGKGIPGAASLTAPSRYAGALVGSHAGGAVGTLGSLGYGMKQGNAMRQLIFNKQGIREAGGGLRGFFGNTRQVFSAATPTAGGHAGVFQGIGSRANLLRAGNILPVLGGAMSVMSAIDFFSAGGGSAIDTGNATLSGSLSAAMIGAGLGAMVGSIVPGFGTGIGAAVGAGVGALADPAIAAFMSLVGIQSRQSKNTNKHFNAMKGIRDRNVILSGTHHYSNKSRELYDMQVRKLDLFQQAIDADIRTGKGGDTEAFRQFLRFINADPSLVNRDEYFDKLVRDGLDSELMGSLKNMEAKETRLLTQGMRHANMVLGNFASGIRVTAEAMNEFVRSLGFDPMNIDPSLMAGAATVMAARKLQINRDMAITPSMAGSTIARTYARATANAKLNAIARGDISPAAIQDFITAKAQFEISRGKPADIAALSGIFDLFRFGNDPQNYFGANTGQIMDVGLVMAQDMARQMEQLNYGSYEQIMAFINAGNASGLDRMIQNKADFRDAIGGGNLNMKPGRRLQILKNNNVRLSEQFFASIDRSMGTNLFSQYAYDQLDKGSTSAFFGQLSAGTYGAGDRKGETFDQGQMDQAITRALIEAGLAGNEIEVLRSINEQLGLLPDQLQKVQLFVNSVEQGGDRNSIAVYIDNEGVELDIDEAFGGEFENYLNEGRLKLTDQGGNTFLVTGTLVD